MKTLLLKSLTATIFFLFIGTTTLSAQSTLLFEETFPDLNLGDRGWYDGVGDSGYNLVYDSILQKNVLYQEWTTAGSGTGNSDPAFPDGVSSALRHQFTASSEITVHLAVKYHKYVEYTGLNHHQGIGRGYGTWSAMNGPLTTYLEPAREGNGVPAVISNGEVWVGPAWAQDALEAMGYTNIQNPPYNNFPDVSRTYKYQWREPPVTHTDMNNINWLEDDQWYEIALNVKSSSTDAKVLFLIREYGTENWTTLSNESGFNMGDMDELFNQYWIGSYLHDNRQEGARSYTGWVRVYQGDAINDGTLSINREILDNTISITPNPTSNTFIIDLQNETLEKAIIYNQLGQQVKEVTTNEVTISNLAGGIYVVKITSESGKTATKKIIKN